MKVMVLNPPSRYAKNVVRDLFYGCWCKGKRIAAAKFPPSTLLYIATILKNEGHEIVFLDTQSSDKDMEYVKAVVKRRKPEAIIIPTSTMSFREDVETLKELKNIGNATTMAYGSHVTFLPKISLEETGLDFIVMREPEYIIRDLINALSRGSDPKKIRGVGFRENGKKKINEAYPFIQNLDELPFPDRSYIKDFSYFNPLVKRIPWITAITSRGCPGRCNFCTSPSFYGSTLRARSPENVVDEMEEIAGMGYKEIFYRDETFTANRQRVERICELIRKRGIDISWICSARVGTVDRGLMIKMKNAGCHMLRFGVESGVQRILDNINKGIRIDMTRKTFKWANEIGMETHAHVMIGCVGDTMDTVNHTIRFIREIEPTTATFGAFTPFPGTEVFDMVKEKVPEIEDGTACDLSKIHTIGFHSYVFTELTDKEIGLMVKEAYKRFYLRPGYILNRMKTLRSLGELRRIVSAGIEVFSFSAGDDSDD